MSHNFYELKVQAQSIIWDTSTYVSVSGCLYLGCHLELQSLSTSIRGEIRGDLLPNLFMWLLIGLNFLGLLDWGSVFLADCWMKYGLRFCQVPSWEAISKAVCWNYLIQAYNKTEWRKQKALDLLWLLKILLSSWKKRES